MSKFLKENGSNAYNLDILRVDDKDLTRYHVLVDSSTAIPNSSSFAAVDVQQFSVLLLSLPPPWRHQTEEKFDILYDKIVSTVTRGYGQYLVCKKE